MGKGAKTLFFILNLVFGLYFINFGLEFFEIPELISVLDKWIFVIGGVLIILGGINYTRTLINKLDK
jgi:hypothetical protein